MTDILLRDLEQNALRALLLSEPVPGKPLPGSRVLENIARLVPCDCIAVDIADQTGRVLASVSLPRTLASDYDPQVCDGPLWLGLIHVGRMPKKADHLAASGVVDLLLLGFRNGSDCIAQLVLERKKVPFSARDIAMLSLISPAVQRLVRDRATPHLPSSLTVQERRTLVHVAAGLSNAEIAERLTIAPSTVRKHLEHAYRKLGVTSRMAAVVALRAGQPGDPDVLARINRYA